MRSRNLAGLILCGWVSGVVFYLVTVITLALFAGKTLSVVETVSTYPRWGGELFFAIDLLMGVWSVWLYSAISPRYGRGPATAAIAGIAWWGIKSLQSAHWVGLGFVPLEVVPAPLATSLVSALCAVLAGAFLYERLARQVGGQSSRQATAKRI